MSRPKEKLGLIIREVGNIFNVSNVSDALHISREQAAKTLARWAQQGWITRLKRGLYTRVPIESSTNSLALDEPWELTPELFSPCYIGGWSATEHWGYTEQIFNDICVITGKKNIKKTTVIHNIKYVITRFNLRLHFGTKIVWKNQTKVFISDPHKTILDIIYNPTLGGGIQHVIACFQEYIKSSDCNFEKIAEYSLKYESGALYKRLGYLLEVSNVENELLVGLCKSNLSKGYSYFDPKIKSGSLVTRWKLYVPESMRPNKL